MYSINEIEIAANEFVELRRKVHHEIAKKLDQGSFENGTTLIYKGNFMRIELTIKDDTQKSTLHSYGTLSPNARYFLKAFAKGISTPFRLEIDNKWNTPHINSCCSQDNHRSIPNWGTSNISSIGSTVTGVVLGDCLVFDLMKRHLKYGGFGTTTDCTLHHS